MDIYLIRHSRVDNPDNRCYGHYEMKLTPDFNLVAEQLKAWLAIKPRDCIYSSSSQRCTILARYLSEKEICVDDRFKELSFGDWENRMWDEINQVDLNLWMQNYVEKSPPGGESYLDLYNRSIQAFNEILSAKSDKAYIITHAGVIRSIIAYILEIKLEKTFQLKIDYAGTTKISFIENSFYIEYINRPYDF